MNEGCFDDPSNHTRPLPAYQFLMVEITPHNTYGALAVGICVAIFLFGMVTLQAIDYLTNFREDRRLFRITIVVLWFLELGHTMSLTSELYLAALPGATAKLKFDGLGAALILGALSTFMVQAFFSRRIWSLLPRPYNFIGILCFALSLLRTIGTLFLAVHGIRDGNIVLFRVRWGWLISGLLGLNTSVDIIIAASLVSFLVMQKKEGFGRFGRIVDRLVAYTIRTGLLTSITAVAALICFQTMPWNFVWMAIYCSLSKLYSSSLLASLVERRKLRNTIQGSSSRSSMRPPRFSLSRETQNKASGSHGQSSLSPGERHNAPIVIEMNTTSTTDCTHAFPELASRKEQEAANEV